MSEDLGRRAFLKSGAMGASTLLTTAGLTRSLRAADSLKKAVLISMLPKQMSYLDRFKLAVDVGFEGLEAQTIADPREADQIKEASEKTGLRIHSVMNVVSTESSPESETKSYPSSPCAPCDGRHETIQTLWPELDHSLLLRAHVGGH